jgi:membrane-bound inhibitor of C-type lysozyme
MNWSFGHPGLGLLATLALSAAVSACAGKSPTSEVIAGTYQCDGGKTFSFTTAPGSETVTLKLDDKSYPLQQQPVAGPTQYSDGTLTFWPENGGQSATLAGTAEPYSNCEAVAWQGDTLG